MPLISLILGTPILLIGIAVTMNRVPWLPDRLLDHALAVATVRHALEQAIRYAERFEHLVRPRLPGLTATAAANQANGLVLVLATLILLAPLPLVPFTNALPGLAILFLCLGMAERDGVLVLLGYLSTVAEACTWAASSWPCTTQGLRPGGCSSRSSPGCAGFSAAETVRDGRFSAALRRGAAIQVRP